MGEIMAIIGNINRYLNSDISALTIEQIRQRYRVDFDPNTSSGDWSIYSDNGSRETYVYMVIEDTGVLSWTGHWVCIGGVSTADRTRPSIIWQSNIPIRVRVVAVQFNDVTNPIIDTIVDINSDELGIGFYSAQYTFINYYWFAGTYGYNSISSALSALATQSKAINYNLTNCTAPSAPLYATPGNNVSVSLRFPTGFSVINPESDVVVRNNGVRINANYSTDQANTGTVSFVMP